MRTLGAEGLSAVREALALCACTLAALKESSDRAASAERPAVIAC